MQEISWKDNLRVAWFGSFLTGASISLVVPFHKTGAQETVGNYTNGKMSGTWTE